MKHDASAKEAFLAEVLKPGELYAGIILGKNGEPDYHLILINGQANDVIWEKAKEFAAKSDGELPTLREQSLLFANLKEQFEERWYWSGEQHASLSACAWGQNFGYGDQYDYDKSYEGSARAVRRVTI
jgi:hypothetical protein